MSRQPSINDHPGLGAVLVCATATLVAGLCHAEQDYELALGVGVGGLSAPAYRGSSERSDYLVPVPYVTYRSPRVRVDRDGARGILYGNPDLELGFSLGLSLPVDSADNSARAGMPDLDPALELGPSLDLTLSRGTGYTLELQLPVRASVAVDDGATRQIGWVFNPALRFDQTLPGARARVTCRLGAQFGDDAYHDYFYGVAERFVTAERRAYGGEAGFGGYSASVAVRTERPSRWWFGVFARYDDVREAVFRRSDLADSGHGFALGAALVWIFHSSGPP